MFQLTGCWMLSRKKTNSWFKLPHVHPCVFSPWPTRFCDNRRSCNFGLEGPSRTIPRWFTWTMRTFWTTCVARSGQFVLERSLFFGFFWQVICLSTLIESTTEYKQNETWEVFFLVLCVCLLVAAPLNIIFRVFALWFVFPGSRNPLSLKSHLLLKLLPFFNGMAHCTSFGFWVSTVTFWKVLPKIKTGAVHRTCIKLI